MSLRPRKYTKKFASVVVSQYLVRCLGPAEVGEHFFMTTDKAKLRICKACQDRIDWQRVSPRAVPVNSRFDQ